VALTVEQQAALETALLADQELPTDAVFRNIRGVPKQAYWEQPDGTWWITDLAGTNPVRFSHTRGVKPDWAVPGSPVIPGPP
jgi:hypothetical protein